LVVNFHNYIFVGIPGHIEAENRGTGLGPVKIPSKLLFLPRFETSVFEIMALQITETC
jgi:hypothetical protein